MPKFNVIKTLELGFDCEAADAREAKGKASAADDSEFYVVECAYDVRQVDPPTED